MKHQQLRQQELDFSRHLREPGPGNLKKCHRISLPTCWIETRAVCTSAWSKAARARIKRLFTLRKLPTQCSMACISKYEIVSKASKPPKITSSSKDSRKYYSKLPSLKDVCICACFHLSMCLSQSRILQDARKGKVILQTFKPALRSTVPYRCLKKGHGCVPTIIFCSCILHYSIAYGTAFYGPPPQRQYTLMRARSTLLSTSRTTKD